MLSMMNPKASMSRCTVLVAVVALGCWSANLWAAPGGNGNGVGNGGRPPGAEPEEGVGNNLSNPVLFPEGHGLLGLPVSENDSSTYANTGLRGSAEIADLGESLPYFRDVAAEEYYLQSVPEFVWQAEWEDRLGKGLVEVTADWSDNLVRQQWTTQSVVRVEMVLTDLLQGVGDTDPGDPVSPAQLRAGYPMDSLGGTKKDEVWAASSSEPTSQNPTAYSIVPRLTIQKLTGDQIDGDHGVVDSTSFDAAIYEGFGTTGPGGFSAEVNAAGKVIYGFNWNLRDETVPNKEGWWRLGFSLDEHATYTLFDEEEEPLYEANVTRNTILSEPSSARHE